MRRLQPLRQEDPAGSATFFIESVTLQQEKRFRVPFYPRFMYNKIVKYFGGERMAYVINDACIACGACEPECPTEAISPGDIYVIDAEKCIDCGACNAVCPVDAPQPQ